MAFGKGVIGACCYVATPIYIFTYFPYSTGHLSVSQIYRSSDGNSLGAVNRKKKMENHPIACVWRSAKALLEK